MEVIFVCTGNICRSPMAEYLLRHKAEQAGCGTLLSVSSAGVSPMTGWQASTNARAVMAERGIDMTAHRASGLTPARLRRAGLILTMTREHKAALAGLGLPDVQDKLYTLPEYAGVNGDVADPYGGDMRVYRHTAEVIEAYIDTAFDRMVKLARKWDDIDAAEC